VYWATKIGLINQTITLAITLIHRLIKYSLDFLRPIRTAEAFEAVDWLADLPRRTWLPVELRHFDVILLKSTAVILLVDALHYVDVVRA